MTAADDAYNAAEAAIEKARAEGASELDLTGDDFAELERLPDSLGTLTDLRSLQIGIRFRSSKFADLAPLQGLTALQTLRLDDTQVTDLAPLQGLTALQTLRLDDTQVTDLAPLQGLTALQALWLNNTQVADLTPLQGLTALQTLQLNGTQVADIAPLQGLTALQTLLLNGTQVADIAPLQGLTALQTLDLDNTQVADLAPLQGLTALQWLDLHNTQVTDLAPLQGLTALQELRLDSTQVADLAPLQGLTALQALWLNGTQVADLAPLQGLTALQTLWLIGSPALDLRPLRALRRLAEEPELAGLTFRNTAATRADPRIAEIAQIEDPKDRARQLFAYLEDWEPPVDTPDRPELPADDAVVEPLSVTALLEAQDVAGWRFSPHFGALELFVVEGVEQDHQSTLAKEMTRRLGELEAKVTGRSDALGIRADVAAEAAHFAKLLADEGRTLSARALEFWGSLVALGALLEANDAARADGRDPLDCLTQEGRAALQTLLAVGAGFVRSFPEARDLDDALGGFNKAQLSPELLTQIVGQAAEQQVVTQLSATLIGHIAEIGEGAGTQADKAYRVTARGIKNLALSAGLIAAAGGVVAGITADIGGDISDHRELGEKANRFLDAVERELHEMIEALSPDEKANLRSVLRDWKAKRHGSRLDSDG